MAYKEKRLRKILGDKGLKTLERVIKQKRKFLGNTKPEEYQMAQSGAYIDSKYLIYVSNTTIETANIMTLLEEMKPLFVYIFSCVVYERLQLTWVQLHMKTNFLNMRMADIYDLNFWPLGNMYERPLGTIQERIDGFKEEEYYISFQKPLRIEIMFKTRRQQEVFRTQINQSDSDDSDDEEASQSYSDDSDDEEKEELSINDFKTFKSDQCVICLEKEPKVLFCNCGHICICEKCLVHRHDDCPVCKKKNTILRIIE